MVKNKKLARAISDASFGTFRTFIKYKAEKKHKIVAVVGRFYASSKICSKCDEKNPLLTLNDRQLICPKCRTVHERDDNASSNIFREGIRILCA